MMVARSPLISLARAATRLALAVATFGLANAAVAQPFADTDIPTAAIPVAPAPEPALPRPSIGQASLLRDAVAAYRRGDLAAGDRVRDAMSDPAAAALLDWAAIRFGGSLVPFERVVAFARNEPDWPGAAWLRRRAEEELVAEKKPAAIVRAFFATERPQSAAGKLALASAFRAEGLNEDAAALVRDAWRNDAFGRDLEARFLEEAPGVLSEADHRARMERFLLKENWDGAKRAADLAGPAYGLLLRARIAVVGQARNAAKLLEAVPAALRADSSYAYSRAQMLRRGEKFAEAAKALEGVSRDPSLLGEADEWWVERRVLARKLLDTGQAAAAYGVASGYAALSTEKRIEAEFHAGWIALRFLSEPMRAGRHFSRAAAMAVSPISVARAAYWRGRASEAMGAADDAREFYAAAARQGTTYYGQLAAAKLGLPPPPLRTAADGAASPSRAARAVALLYGANLREIAAPLMAEIARSSRNAAEIDAVAGLATREGEAKAVLMLGKGGLQRGLPLDDHAFPTIGIPSFEPVGTRVEPAMVYAIARQESTFDPTALSTAGARGLMQLMPATALRTAKRAGVEFDNARLLDGTYNARLGAAHLGDLMGDWKGSHILVFASYNAGGGNVQKWITAYGDPRKEGVDPVDWVERIPFSETRNYVQRVMENLQVYRRRLEERSAALAGPAGPTTTGSLAAAAVAR